MFEAIRKLAADLARGDGADEFREDDYRLAAAALLVHVAEVDGVLDESERLRLPRALSTGFGMDPDSTGRLIDVARRKDREAIDFQDFASVLKRQLDLAGRARIIAMMYDIAYADGVLHEFEGDIVARVAETLEIPEADVAELRRKAAGEPEVP